VPTSTSAAGQAWSPGDQEVVQSGGGRDRANLPQQRRITVWKYDSDRLGQEAAEQPDEK